MRITILGNSVALRVRPPQPHPENKNYTILLREKLPNDWNVENKGIGASTIYDQIKDRDQLLNSFPDVFILNIGVVDSTVREIPFWFNRIILGRTRNPLFKVLNFIYRKIISKNRSFFSRMRGKQPWVNKNQFRKEFDFLIKVLLKETNAQIITLPINLANERIEKQLPGSRKNHEAYNAIIAEITAKHQQHFLDLSDLNSEQHYPDGVHFNTEGHEIIAERLLSVLKNMK